MINILHYQMLLSTRYGKTLQNLAKTINLKYQLQQEINNLN